MDYNLITQADIDGFRANLNMTPQVTESVYLPHVDADLAYSEPGKLFNIDTIGTSDPKKVNTVVPDSPEGIVDMTRRVGSFESFHDGKFIESIQKVHQLQDPTNEVMAAMRAGKMRYADKKIRDSFFAAVRIGESGENTLNFPSGNLIAVNSRTRLHSQETASLPASPNPLPLTLGKLLTVRERIKRGRVMDILPGSRLKIAVRQADISQLLTTIPVTSGDYATIRRLESGEINSYLGFDFVWDEDVPLAAGQTDQYILPVWIDRAMKYKSREIHNASISVRGDKSNRPYAYYETEHGALRGWDDAVFGIIVKDL